MLTDLYFKRAHLRIVQNNITMTTIKISLFGAAIFFSLNIATNQRPEAVYLNEYQQ